jgi:hypothetical protein
MQMSMRTPRDAGVILKFPVQRTGTQELALEYLGIQLREEDMEALRRQGRESHR